MSSDFDLKKIQTDFLNHILKDEPDCKEHIKDVSPLGRDERLSIYSSAYRIRLRETIDIDHPILGIFLGDDLFNEMVEKYINKYPSKFRSLRYFCERLPQFLSEELPFSDHPILASLASFERLLMKAFDDSDKDQLLFEDLQKLSLIHI